MQTDLDFRVLKLIDSKSGDDYFKTLVSYVYQNFCDQNVKPFITLGDKKKTIGFYQMATIMKNITEATGITPSTEQWIYILSNKKRLLCEACAGSGKTTISLFKIICTILFYGVEPRDALTLAYNKHAANDLEIKFASLRDKINAMQIPGIKLEGSIIANTFHSWCRTWLDAYKEIFGYENLNLAQLDDYEQVQLFQVAFKNMCTANKMEINPDDSLIQSFIALFSYTKERCITKDTEAWKVCSEFQNLKEFGPEKITQVFKFYARLKKSKQKFDYVDLVDKMYNIVKDVGKSKRIRANYKMVLVDEYQDMTLAMKRVLIMLLEGSEEDFVDRFDDCYLSCIGDGDQSIYSFRGTQSDNCLLFKEEYSKRPEDVRILTMSINRRCKSAILEPAIKAINSIGDRIEKPISALNEGGHVYVKEYMSQDEQVNDILQELQGKKNCSNYCVAYRNISSSKHLIMKCFELDIPCNIVKGNVPLSDKMSETLRGMLELLDNPLNLKLAQKYLYRVVPKGSAVKRDTIYKALQNRIEAIEKSSREHYVKQVPFWEIPIPNSEEIRDFAPTMKILQTLSDKVSRGVKMTEFFQDLFNLVMRYYIQGLMSSFMQSDFTQDYLNFIFRFFNKPVSYRLLKSEIQEHLDFQKANQSRGVYLTTMHGLKGLEFENVIVIDMMDGLFPGNELRNPDLTAVQRSALELEARRLLYVTITRAKTNLTLYFSKTQPSRYLKYFVEDPQVEMYATRLAELQEGAPENAKDSGYYFNEDWRQHNATNSMTFNEVVDNYKIMHQEESEPQFSNSMEFEKYQKEQKSKKWGASSIQVQESVDLMSPTIVQPTTPTVTQPAIKDSKGVEFSSLAMSEYLFTDEGIKSSIASGVAESYANAENKFLTIEQKTTIVAPQPVKETKSQPTKTESIDWSVIESESLFDDFEGLDTEDEFTLEEAPDPNPVIEEAPDLNPVIEEAPDLNPAIEEAPDLNPAIEEAPDLNPAIEEAPDPILDEFLKVGNEIEKEQNLSKDTTEPLREAGDEFDLGSIFDDGDSLDALSDEVTDNSGLEEFFNDTDSVVSEFNADNYLESVADDYSFEDVFNSEDTTLRENETDEFTIGGGPETTEVAQEEEKPIIENKPGLSRVLRLIEKRKANNS